MWFGLVRLTFKMKFEPNQIKPMWFRLDRLMQFFFETIQFFVFNIKIKLQS